MDIWLALIVVGTLLEKTGRLYPIHSLIIKLIGLVEDCLCVSDKHEAFSI